MIQRKLKFVIQWHPGKSISLFIFEKSGGLSVKSCSRKFESLLLRESLDESLALKVKAFLGNLKAHETLLVIPRSEVLQKEMVFLKSGGLRENLEARLAQLLPSPKEMAYALAVDSDETTTRSLLYAIPERKIKEILEFLTRLGIAVDEVASEDQVLYWLFQKKAAAGPVIVIDRTSERTLFLALKEKTILFSRTYPGDEELKNILPEISFSLLESGVKPARVFISGTVERDQIAKGFEIPVESYELESLEGSSLPLALTGSRLWGEYPAISLLPSEQKISRRRQGQKRIFRESLIALGFFIVCFFLLAASHLFFLKHKKAALEKETARLAPAVSQIRQMAASLGAIDEAEHSKQRLLSLLKELAGRVPPSIRFKELHVENKDIVFRGESPSHGSLSETVQVFEKMEGIEEAKLGHARLRKRLNQELFEFEITAKWKN